MFHFEIRTLYKVSIPNSNHPQTGPQILNKLFTLNIFSHHKNLGNIVHSAASQPVLRNTAFFVSCYLSYNLFLIGVIYMTADTGSHLPTKGCYICC